MLDIDRQIARQTSIAIVPNIARRVPYGAIPSSIGGSIADSIAVGMTRKPRKISPLSEILNITQSTRTIGHISAQPVSPAATRPHNLIDWGRSEGNKNGIDGGSGRKSEIVRHGMDKARKVKPYVVHTVASDRAEGSRKRCLTIFRGC